MKTTNWQTKALTLFIAALALWLAAACAHEYTGREIITPSAPCGLDAPLEPSKEFQQFVGLEHVYYFLRTDRKNRATRWRAERLKPETERIQAILDNFRDQIERSSNGYINNQIPQYSIVDIENDKGLLTDKQAIHISVYEKLGQSRLHHEYGIPECIEGIEVHLRVRKVETAL